MSLFNLMNGYNPSSPLYLAALKLDPNTVPRFRDTRLARVRNRHYIVILTRAGGKNRQDYQGAIDKLCEHPLYARNQDCTHDNTYADFYFKPPEVLHPLIEALAEIGRDHDLSPEQIYDNNVAAIQKRPIPHLLPQASEEELTFLEPIIEQAAKEVRAEDYLVIPIEDRIIEIQRGEG